MTIGRYSMHLSNFQQLALCSGGECHLVTLLLPWHSPGIVLSVTANPTLPCLLTKGDCWLKFTEGPGNPEINFRGSLSQDYLKRHPTSADFVQWDGGVLLPAGMPLSNGTFGPRYAW